MAFSGHTTVMNENIDPTLIDSDSEEEIQEVEIPEGEMPEEEPAMNGRVHAFHTDDGELVELPEDPEEAELNHVAEAAEKYIQERLATELNELSTVSEEIPQNIKDHIEQLTYPKILMGEFNIRTRDHPLLVSKGKMSEKAKDFFRVINTILQYPPSVTYRSNHYKPKTQSAYATHIARYVQYVADHTEQTPSTFVVCGSIMKECMAHVLKTSGDNQEINGNPVLFACIPMFKYSMYMLQHSLGLFKTRHITDTNERAGIMERNWRLILQIEEIDKFFDFTRSEWLKLIKNMYLDKNRSSMFQKKYTTENLKQMMVNMFKLTGSGKKADIYRGVNAPLEFLSGHHLLFRSLNKVALELSDSVYTEEETAHGVVPILGFQFITGKTLSVHSNPGLLGACRNKHFEICLVGAFALSCWYRFDFENEHAPLAGSKRPDFLRKESWYDPKVLFSTNSSTDNLQVSDSYANSLATSCFESIGLESAKKLHAGRTVNSLRADANQVPENQIRRAGRWKLDVLESRYISSYAYDFLHFSGGFQAEEPYYIARNIEVDERLQTMIFPWLEPEIAKVKKRNKDQKKKDKADKSSVTKARAKSKNGAKGKKGAKAKDRKRELNRAKERDGSVLGFLEMLKSFRSIIVQDLAMWMKKAPDSVYCKHEITKTALFKDFMKEMDERLENTSLFPGVPDIQDTVNFLTPIIGLRLKTIRQAIDTLNLNFQDRTSAQEQTFRKLETRLPAMLALKMKEELSELLTSESTAQSLRHKEVMDRINRQIGEQLRMLVREELGPVIRDELDRFAEEKMRPIMTQVINDALDRRLGATDAPSISQNPSSEQANTPMDEYSADKYQLIPLNQCVLSLMEEWFVGVNGRPSIEIRDTEDKSKWRKGERLTLWKKKKAVIFCVEDLAQIQNVDMHFAAGQLEEYRKSRNFEMSSFYDRMKSRGLRYEVEDAILDGRFQEEANSRRKKNLKPAGRSDARGLPSTDTPSTDTPSTDTPSTDTPSTDKDVCPTEEITTPILPAKGRTAASTGRKRLRKVQQSEQTGSLSADGNVTSIPTAKTRAVAPTNNKRQKRVQQSEQTGSLSADGNVASVPTARDRNFAQAEAVAQPRRPRRRNYRNNLRVQSITTIPVDETETTIPVDGTETPPYICTAQAVPLYKDNIEAWRKVCEEREAKRSAGVDASSREKSGT